MGKFSEHPLQGKDESKNIHLENFAALNREPSKSAHLLAEKVSSILSSSFKALPLAAAMLLGSVGPTSGTGGKLPNNLGCDIVIDTDGGESLLCDEDKYNSKVYAGMIQDVFDGEAVLPEYFPEISNGFIKPLHKTLIEQGIGGEFTGHDAADITALVMLMGKEDFGVQFDHVSKSFPADNGTYYEKLEELFSPGDM